MHEAETTTEMNPTMTTTTRTTKDTTGLVPTEPTNTRLPVPMRLARRIIGLASIVVAALVLTGCLSETEQASLELVNRARVDNGVGVLAPDEDLTAVARDWAAQMAEVGVISHRPDDQLMAMLPAGWRSAAENVGVGPDVGKVHVAFLDSSSHRASMLEARFTRVGIGAVEGEDGRIYVAHVFME
ncbi:MAG: CAP domain-containing protein [Actinomycetota bacterium]|nr:CAP domain-containing protein [Actinomycetota bacterium]